MSARIARSLHDRLLALAAAAPGREVCGLLFGADGRIAAIGEAANVAAAPQRAFEIDPRTLVAAYRAERGGGPRVIGHYHSHPGGRPVPSAADAAAARPDGRLWVIVAGGTVAAWRFGFAGFVAVPLVVEA